MKSRTKEDIISKYMIDAESKANSLYSKGYKAGKNDGYALGKEKADESFEMGSRMAIAALRHLWASTDMTAEKVLNLSDEEILKAMTREAKKPNLTVGDEVKDSNGFKAVVTNVDTHIHLIYPHNGKTWKASFDEPLEPTGRSFCYVRVKGVADTEYVPIVDLSMIEWGISDD